MGWHMCIKTMFASKGQTSESLLLCHRVDSINGKMSISYANQVRRHKPL